MNRADQSYDDDEPTAMCGMRDFLAIGTVLAIIVWILAIYGAIALISDVTR